MPVHASVDLEIPDDGMFLANLRARPFDSLVQVLGL